ncbi:MAG: hypothetical protein KC421_25200 [Anaerolineales bacterium]|nr:hypothetical protein [Anaerolineales bacterium]
MCIILINWVDCKKYGRSLLYGPDGLAIAVATEPDIVQEAAQRFVA